MSGELPLDAELTLEHVQWLRALARRLVDDPQAADDLAQDAWVVALERPEREGALRAWLAGVVRNLALQRGRGEARRRRREELSARPEELTDRTLDVCREVLEAVRELDEPFRTTIRLRYFDGLPPR